MSGAIVTERLILRPIRHSDAPELERVIFGDPEVVKGLAHDGSDPSERHIHSTRWCEFGPDGDTPMWHQTGMGLFVITDNSGDFAPTDEFLGISGVYIDQEENQWSGEMFYALGSQYHGKGIMSEACGAVVDSFKSLPDSGSLYAVYWRILNPASGRILRRLGFVEDGNKSLLDEYSVERIEGIRAFEIWRLRHSPAQQLSRIVEEVSIKLGHCAAEGVFSREDCLKEIDSMLPATEDIAALRPIIDAGLNQGLEVPGLAMMRLRSSLSR